MLDRIIGVLSFNAAKYREIAEDKSATLQAGIIIGLALFIQGFISGFIEVDSQTGTALTNMILGLSRAAAVLISGLIAWVIAGCVITFIAKLLGGKTNIGEMLRVTGYVAIFGILSFLSLLALSIPSLGFIAEIVIFIVGILELFGYIFGVSKVAEISVRKTFFITLVAAVINLPIILFLTDFILKTLRISGA